ncbi:MAG: hypothetical protein FWD55_09095 [Propionibacteriaceae bacterium]|nr:hypothetical protein [Propionibacteriaceae bacterium]
MTIAEERTSTGQLSELEQALFDHLKQRLTGLNLSELGPLDAVADRMVASLPRTDSVWKDIAGPVYTSRGLQKWLGISRQAISQHAKERRILRLITADGISVFPAFQFDDHGHRLPHLKDVLDILYEGLDDPWTWATWLNTPIRNGESYADRLRQGEWESVLEQAREDAWAWSRP